MNPTLKGKEVMLFVSEMEDIIVKYARHRKTNAAWVHLSKNNNFEAESEK